MGWYCVDCGADLIEGGIRVEGQAREVSTVYLRGYVVDDSDGRDPPSCGDWWVEEDETLDSDIEDRDDFEWESFECMACDYSRDHLAELVRYGDPDGDDDDGRELTEEQDALVSLQAALAAAN